MSIDNANNKKRIGSYQAAFGKAVEACSTLAHARNLGEKDGQSAVGTLLREGRNGKDRAGLAAVMLAEIPAVESLVSSDDSEMDN